MYDFRIALEKVLCKIKRKYLGDQWSIYLLGLEYPLRCLVFRHSVDWEEKRLGTTNIYSSISLVGRNWENARGKTTNYPWLGVGIYT